MATRTARKLRRWYEQGGSGSLPGFLKTRQRERSEARKERAGKPGLLTYALLSEGLKQSAKRERHPLRVRNRGDSVARRERRLERERA